MIALREQQNGSLNPHWIFFVVFSSLKFIYLDIQRFKIAWNKHIFGRYQFKLYLKIHSRYQLKLYLKIHSRYQLKLYLKIQSRYQLKLYLKIHSRYQLKLYLKIQTIWKLLTFSQSFYLIICKGLVGFYITCIIPYHLFFQDFTQILYSTVKTAHDVTSIKQSPVLKGHLFLALS